LRRVPSHLTGEVYRSSPDRRDRLADDTGVIAWRPKSKHDSGQTRHSDQIIARKAGKSEPEVSGETAAPKPAKPCGRYFSGELLHILAISGPSRVRTEFFQLFVVHPLHHIW